MIKLIWTVAFVYGMQPQQQDVAEATKFKTVAECESYGEAHTQRMEDWARGVLRWPFEAPMKAVYRCEAEERPA